MVKINKLKSNYMDFLYDHPKTKIGRSWTWKIFVTAVSALIFAYGFRAFIAPTVQCVAGWFPKHSPSDFDANGLSILYNGVKQSDFIDPTHLIAGGASGISQAIIRFVEIFANIKANEKTITSILYFVLNVPLLILAFFKISKSFAVSTLINVGFVSLFNYIIPDAWIYNVVNLYTNTLARCIFGGITTGISSGLARIINSSAGGTDILSIYFSEKKHSQVGKISFVINAIIIVSYRRCTVIGQHTNPSWNTGSSNDVITLALYSIIYYFRATKVIDVLNVRNRKQQLTIFTNDKDRPKVLIRAFPHTATVVQGTGAYSGQEKLVIYRVISKPEEKKAISLVRKADPEAFLTVSDLNQVYGRFFIKPLE